MKMIVVILICISIVIPCSAKIIYVDGGRPGGDGSSWENSYRHLQDALLDALPGDEIRVAEGTYSPDIMNGFVPPDPEATFQLKTGVTINGGFAGFGEPNPDERNISLYKSILSGEWTFYHVVTGS